MTKQEAQEMGRQHAAAGKRLTPFDCQTVDATLFAVCRNSSKPPARAYADLRGRFQSWLGSGLL